MSKKLTQSERKEWAKTLFLNEDRTIPDIAIIVTTDESTVRAWVHEGDWIAQKERCVLSRASQLKYYYALLNKIKYTDEGTLKEPTTKDADLMLKYSAIIKNLEVELSISDIVEVFESFIRWLQRRDLALCKKLVPYMDAFIKERLAD
ncbi:MAG: hypothetical protein JWQ38_3398 [Flavipsychrobacter sp.]|nr:hypothetical protein [Flavipsychrobacter sp.]